MKSCKKATFLISKKEEGRLTSREAIGLAWHLSVCSLCRSFEKQTQFFSSKKKEAPIIPMPEVMKKRLQQLMQDSFRQE